MTKDERNSRRLKVILILSAFVVPFQNCSGFSADQLSSSGAGSFSITGSLSDRKAYGATAIRRLTRTEISNSLSDVFGVAPDPSDLQQLPEDIASTMPFNNEYQTQAISDLVVLGYDIFAENYSESVAADSSVVKRVAGCSPSSASDAPCFSSFMKKAGRRILRRTITDAEVTTYSNLLLPYAAQDGKFSTAVQLLVQAWTLNPEFLYRVEAGETTRPEPGVIQLSEFEIASRMSYLLWGSGPDDALLDAADAGKLISQTERASQARRMLADPRAKRQVELFAGQWLGFDGAYLPPAQDADMRAESNATIDRVFSSNGDWLSIFTLNSTYVTPALASYYGLPAITSPAWVNSRGGGVLSHGTVAALGAKFGDTSPTERGYQIFKRVMCQETGPIPPGVDPDTQPGSPSDCKPVRYSMRTLTSCASCHTQFDGIGFGLENEGPYGAWRTTEPGNPNCAITGAGDLPPANFNGPKELGTMLAKDDRVAACASTQLFRFMTGRSNDSNDAATLQALKMQYYQTPGLQDLLVSLVSSPAIMNKLEVQ